MKTLFKSFAHAVGLQRQPGFAFDGELALAGGAGTDSNPFSPANISLMAHMGNDFYTGDGRSAAPGLASWEPASPNQAPRFNNNAEKLLKKLKAIPALMKMAGDGQTFEYSFSYREKRVGVEIFNPRIIPPQNLPPREEIQVDCRVSMPMPGRSLNRVTTLEADFKIGGMNLEVRAEESPNDYTVLSLHDRVDNLELSSVKFRFYGGKLHIYSFYTNARRVRNSFSTSLQRLAYLIAGKPNALVIHELMHTNPCYQSVADAYLDAGTVNGVSFFPEKLATALRRIFDRRVQSFNLLNEEAIEKGGLRVNKQYELSVAGTTTFDVEVNLGGIKA